MDQEAALLLSSSSSSKCMLYDGISLTLPRSTGYLYKAKSIDSGPGIYERSKGESLLFPHPDHSSLVYTLDPLIYNVWDQLRHSISSSSVNNINDNTSNSDNPCVLHLRCNHLRYLHCRGAGFTHELATRAANCYSSIKLSLDHFIEEKDFDYVYNGMNKKVYLKPLQLLLIKDVKVVGMDYLVEINPFIKDMMFLINTKNEQRISIIQELYPGRLLFFKNGEQNLNSLVYIVKLSQYKALQQQRQQQQQQQQLLLMLMQNISIGSSSSSSSNSVEILPLLNSEEYRFNLFQALRIDRRLCKRYVHHYKIFTKLMYTQIKDKLQQTDSRFLSMTEVMGWLMAEKPPPNRMKRSFSMNDNFSRIHTQKRLIESEKEKENNDCNINAQDLSSKSQTQLKEVNKFSSLFDPNDTRSAELRLKAMHDIAHRLSQGELTITQCHTEILRNIDGLAIKSYEYRIDGNSSLSCKKNIEISKVKQMLFSADMDLITKKAAIDIGPCRVHSSHMYKYPGRIPLILRERSTSGPINEDEDLALFIPLQVFRKVMGNSAEAVGVHQFVGSALFVLCGGEYFVHSENISRIVKHYSLGGEFRYREALLKVAEIRETELKDKIKRTKWLIRSTVGTILEYVEMTIEELEMELQRYHNGEILRVIQEESLFFGSVKNSPLIDFNDVFKERTSSLGAINTHKPRSGSFAKKITSFYRSRSKTFSSKKHAPPPPTTVTPNNSPAVGARAARAFSLQAKTTF